MDTRTSALDTSHLEITFRDTTSNSQHQQVCVHPTMVYFVNLLT